LTILSALKEIVNEYAIGLTRDFDGGVALCQYRCSALFITEGSGAESVGG